MPWSRQRRQVTISLCGRCWSSQSHYCVSSQRIRNAPFPSCNELVLMWLNLRLEEFSVNTYYYSPVELQSNKASRLSMDTLSIVGELSYCWIVWIERVQQVQFNDPSRELSPVVFQPFSNENFTLSPGYAVQAVLVSLHMSVSNSAKLRFIKNISYYP